MKVGPGDETEVMKAGCDGSNDDPNIFCNFSGIDNSSDMPVAKHLLRCLFSFVCHTNVTSQMPAVKNKQAKTKQKTQPGPFADD